MLFEEDVESRCRIDADRLGGAPAGAGDVRSATDALMWAIGDLTGQQPLDHHPARRAA